MTTSTSTSPKFAANSNPAHLERQLSPLLKENGGRWTLTSEGNGVERGFKFKGFKKCWVYNTTFIRWTTHSPPGLSEKDILMAKFCDEKASEAGEAEGAGAETGGIGKELADRVAVEGGDCCVPKKQSSA
ncbi:hypothetical protein BP5796_11411 [Coleophoma crateriformis]|uniref:4a-hydroxytetrahydrobiopterin dehydratase n=1 Tax=Coleophoma crateriformis TaxID=565419 RepID=A0A3D8QIB4_9HELO|nr:hypothetical protein BP5796_11411 [Coleophoma crateriformis]